jgi:hypothetical protein
MQFVFPIESCCFPGYGSLSRYCHNFCEQIATPPRFEANPLVNRETMLGRPIASAKQPRTASTQLYDRTEPAVDIAQALGNVCELTRISEHEIHEAVLSCTPARRQTLRSMPTAKPTLN